MLVALGVTVALHAWRRNALISIVGGTLVNVLLLSTVLAG
jgi:branched-subunit amino acid transport protein AzlD